MGDLPSLQQNLRYSVINSRRCYSLGRGPVRRLLPKRYGAILVFGVIPELRRDQVTALVSTIERNLAQDGLLFITAFGTWDPAFGRHQNEWAEDAQNSFCSLDGLVRTYLAPGELVALFPGLDVVHSWEGLGPVHRHGDGPLERHASRKPCCADRDTSGFCRRVLQGPRTDLSVRCVGLRGCVVRKRSVHEAPRFDALWRALKDPPTEGKARDGALKDASTDLGFETANGD